MAIAESSNNGGDSRIRTKTLMAHQPQSVSKAVLAERGRFLQRNPEKDRCTQHLLFGDTMDRPALSFNALANRLVPVGETQWPGPAHCEFKSGKKRSVEICGDPC